MISFRQFSKRFGPVTAVDSLDLDVDHGEVVALLGPNGSGKTTAMKAAAGLIRPSAGSVLVGDPPHPAETVSGRRIASFLPQRVSFPSDLTGHEVLDFYGRLRGSAAARTQTVLSFTNLNGAGRRPVRDYSGGMTQRLALAVALLPEAPVLLLDEPTAALDPDGLHAFYELIEARRSAGQTVLFSSHHIGDVERLADRIVVLVQGRLVASMNADELPARLAERKRLDAFYSELAGAAS